MDSDRYHGDLYLFGAAGADTQELFKQIYSRSIFISYGDALFGVFKLGGLRMGAISAKLVYHRF
jgi:hypothetical protein